MRDALAEPILATIEGETELFVDDELEGHLAVRNRMTRGDIRRLEMLGPIVDELIAAIEQGLDH
jgi:hypothetical protein